MTQHRPIPLDLAFVPADTPTFSELITQLQSEPNLRATRKRDLISGLNRVAKALGLPPTDIPCDSRWLQPRLSRVSPPMIGLNPKSWQNAVSDARAAMAVFGIVQRRSNRTDYLDAHWRPLWEQMIASGDRTLPTALRHVMCSGAPSSTSVRSTNGWNSVRLRDLPAGARPPAKGHLFAK